MDSRQTLQTEIIKRFMADEQYKKFLEDYDSKRKAYNLAKRQDSLGKDVTAEEKKAMDKYYKELEKSIGELAKEMDLTPARFMNLVINGSKKFTYKNY